jgi:hypothetical protein
MHANNIFSSFQYVEGHFKHCLVLYCWNAQMLHMGNEDGRNCYVLFKFYAWWFSLHRNHGSVMVRDIITLCI